MSERQEASIMLEAIDELAPICVDWNNEELWLKAITEGLRRIRTAETERRDDITRETYNDLNRLVSRRIADLDARLDKALGWMADRKADRNCGVFQRSAQLAARYYAERRRLKAALEEFGREAETPAAATAGAPK